MNTSRNSLTIRVGLASALVLGVVVALLLVGMGTIGTFLTAGYLAVVLAVALVFVPLVRRLRADTVRLTNSERRAEEAHQKFEGLFLRAPHAMVTTGEDGSVLSVNGALESMFGYSEEELVGRPIEMLMPERFRANHGDLRDTWFANPTRRPMGAIQGLWGQRRDGAEFPVACGLGWSQAEGGTGIVTLSDLTERREMEDALDAYAKQLERSNEELEEYATVAAHDLQEPLRKIEIFADKIGVNPANDLSEKGLDDLERLERSVQRMRALIDDLLSYARMSTQPRNLESVDLEALAGDVVIDLHDHIEETGGEVHVGHLPVIEADPTQMSQLLRNLIDNALRYHRRGIPPIVTVDGQVVDDDTFGDSQVCRFTVEDNGIGFDETYADQIFSMFQRLHGVGEYPGTGIGLAMCRKIVERHGGEITVISTRGEGSTFTVSLPVNREPQAETGLRDGDDVRSQPRRP